MSGFSPPTIYLDYAATTPVRDEVWEVVEPYFRHKFGNPSSLYRLAEEARNAVENSRSQVAAVLGVRPRDLNFNSGGTEANNSAIKGVAYARQNSGKHIITSAIEHSSVIKPVEQLAEKGWDVSIINTDKYGRVDLEQLADTIRPDTVLVSIMYVNNEIGVIQDIPSISALISRKSLPDQKIVFHTDAIQAAGKLSLKIDELGVDMLTLSGHKLGAPKGAGVLYAHRKTAYEPLIVGGGQEHLKRSGTENVPAIVGLGQALAIADAERSDFEQHTRQLRESLLIGLKGIYPDVLINSPEQHCVPSIVNVSFPNVTGETVLVSLDFEGICASSGSACSSASLEPSAVLLAIGLKETDAISSIRFSFGIHNTLKEVDTTVQKLATIFEKLRQMQ